MLELLYWSDCPKGLFSKGGECLSWYGRGLGLLASQLLLPRELVGGGGGGVLAADKRMSSMLVCSIWIGGELGGVQTCSMTSLSSSCVRHVSSGLFSPPAGELRCSTLLVPEPDSSSLSSSRSDKTSSMFVMSLKVVSGVRLVHCWICFVMFCLNVCLFVCLFVCLVHVFHGMCMYVCW